MTILLIIHRLRFPFGVNNDKADIYSKCILRELDSTRIVTKRVVPFASFSVLVAAIELVDWIERDNLSRDIGHLLGHTKPFRDRLMDHIRFWWHIRDTNAGVRWFNLSYFLQLRPT
jgi:hypothetical protein